MVLDTLRMRRKRWHAVCVVGAVLAWVGAQTCLECLKSVAFAGSSMRSLNLSTRTDSLITRAGGGMVEVPGDLKMGMRLMVDGDPLELLEFMSKKVGKGVAVTKTKMKNLKTGAIIDKTLNSGKKFERIESERLIGSFSYSNDAGEYIFMDGTTFEEVKFDGASLGEAGKWLVEGASIDIEHFSGNLIKITIIDDIVVTVVAKKEQKSGCLLTFANGETRQGASYMEVGNKLLFNKSFQIDKRI